MNSYKRSHLLGMPVLAAVAALAFSPAAWSLGLGDARVESYLNQPLRARIDLLTQEADDVGSVTARLASAADYELIGASRESVSVPIRFSVEDIDGDAYILATSSLPMNDPVVRLIVEVNWSSGRMLREYTLFLDPPTVPEAAPAPRVDQRRQPAAAPAPAAPTAQPAAEPAPVESVPPPPATVPAGGEYGPVRSGETLWRIASDWSRGSGLDVNQVMIAIQRENPEAFLRDNINLLKRGAILRMPAMTDVEAISRAAAYQQVAQQQEAFSGVSAETVASPSTPLLADEAARPEPPPAPAPAAEPAQAMPAEPETTPAAAEPEATEEPSAQPQVADEPEPRDMLELVPPSPDSELDSAYGFEEAEGAATAVSDVDALRENLARKEEELITQQQQNAYLEERVRELESQLENAESAGVADADLANMEARLQEQRQAEARAQAREAAEAAWYTRWWVWLIGLVVVIAAFVGWLFSRRGQGVEAAAASAEASLRDIKSEAEDVLRVLGDQPSEPESSAPAVAQPEPEAAGEAAGAEAAGEPETAAPAATGKKPRRFGPAEGDAELLDEESSDPEIQLDLARAYISMGDKEAARVILEEVLANGTDAQQGEARKMLDLLA